MDERKLNFYALVRFAATQKVYMIPHENNFIDVGDEVVNQEGHIGRVVGLCVDWDEGETAEFMSALNWGEPLPHLKSKIYENEFYKREEADNG